MRFFLDNNLSPKLAKSLNALVQPEHQVFHLKDLFAANTPDEVWMRKLAEEKEWVIISGDLQIRKNPHEVKAWLAAGHTTFFLKSGWINLSFWTQVEKFVKCFPAILIAASSAKAGDVFFVTVKAKIES